MNFSEAFIRRPVMTVLLSASFVVAGVLAYGDIPIAALPQFETPTISVIGQPARARAPRTWRPRSRLPLEKQFATIAGVDAISSTSTQGRTQLTLEFDEDRDIDDGRGGRAGGAAARAAPAAAGDDHPAVVPQGQPGRRADPLRHAHVALDAAVGAERPRREPDRAVALDHPGRGRDRHQRPQALRGARAGAPRRARRAQPHHGRRRHRASAPPTPTRRWARSRARARRSPSRPTASSRARRSSPRSSSPRCPTAAIGAPARTWPTSRTASSRVKTASWTDGERAITLSIRRQPDANTVATVDAIKAALPGWSRRCRAR